MATLRKKFDLTALAARAEKAKMENDPSGFLSSNIYSDFAVTLSGGIVLSDEIPEVDQKRLILKVAHAASMQRPITHESLLKACTDLENDYLSKRMSPYRLITEISLSWTIEIPKIRIGNVHITFKPKLNKAYKFRTKLIEQNKFHFHASAPKNYMKLCAHVKARTPNQAAEQCLDALDLLRASWSIGLNRSKFWRYSSGKPNPINEIQLSPIHTVHFLDGTLATEEYWYDQAYSKPLNLFTKKDVFEKALDFGKKIRLRIQKMKYGVEIENAMIRYVRALDSTDLNDAFLKLWSILEYLTDSTNDSYAVTARRAAFIYEDKIATQLILDNLTSQRNRFVHVGSESYLIESLVFQLKRFVESLLIFHIFNEFKFTSFKDAASFMDLPTEIKLLDEKVLRLQQARKFLAKK